MPRNCDRWRGQCCRGCAKRKASRSIEAIEASKTITQSKQSKQSEQSKQSKASRSIEAIETIEAIGAIETVGAAGVIRAITRPLSCHQRPVRNSGIESRYYAFSSSPANTQESDSYWQKAVTGWAMMPASSMDSFW